MLCSAAMSSDYTLILRACPESHRESAAVFIGKLFSLKEHTCQQIVASCPIVLLAGLGREEAGAIHLLAHGLATVGAQVELSGNPPGDLPKIDWPRRPQVLKRELSEWVVDLQVPVPVPGGSSARIIDLLVAALEGKPPTKSEFKGSQLPEVTPFSTPALPPVEAKPPTTRTPLPAAQAQRTPLPPPPQPASAISAASDGNEDPMSRLNELFPEEEGGGFMPGKEDITNILNRILPDEEGAGGGAPGGSSGSGRRAAEGTGGFSVFLAKIADEDRRKKAAALIAEIGKVPAEEAETLSKKMIIPVLRGVSKEEAEAAKAQFGKIGILARVKGPE
ncbi:MAG: hypothetical protein J0M02_06325 [Planctomycetes bacterium]|nr:hypothetical protein [Planctomycetota bacterium]